mmetsp:Transcript_26921/g.86529  ORF Transcript_26921/g.86529 Transcript_26921/m.86529 type:complete len:541 (-) Transcript_26921:552-2174(-)
MPAHGGGLTVQTQDGRGPSLICIRSQHGGGILLSCVFRPRGDSSGALQRSSDLRLTAARPSSPTLHRSRSRSQGHRGLTRRLLRCHLQLLGQGGGSHALDELVRLLCGRGHPVAELLLQVVQLLLAGARAFQLRTHGGHDLGVEADRVVQEEDVQLEHVDAALEVVHVPDVRGLRFTRPRLQPGRNVLTLDHERRLGLEHSPDLVVQGLVVARARRDGGPELVAGRAVGDGRGHGDRRRRGAVEDEAPRGAVLRPRRQLRHVLDLLLHLHRHRRRHLVIQGALEVELQRRARLDVRHLGRLSVQRVEHGKVHRGTQRHLRPARGSHHRARVALWRRLRLPLAAELGRGRRAEPIADRRPVRVRRQLLRRVQLQLRRPRLGLQRRLHLRELGDQPLLLRVQPVALRLQLVRLRQQLILPLAPRVQVGQAPLQPLKVLSHLIHPVLAGSRLALHAVARAAVAQTGRSAAIGAARHAGAEHAVGAHHGRALELRLPTRGPGMEVAPQQHGHHQVTLEESLPQRVQSLRAVLGVPQVRATLRVT